MPAKYHIGIDISNKTLDLAIFISGKYTESLKIENTEAGITQMLKEVRLRYDLARHNTLFCAEYTGVYGKHLERVMINKRWKICFESPLRIKYSIGISRGKNDKLDAIRIGFYAVKNERELIFKEPPRPCVARLKMLYSKRKLLLKIDGMLNTQRKPNDVFLLPEDNEYIQILTAESRNAIHSDIKRIDQEMDDIIKKDYRLSRLNVILNSIPRVGRVLSVCLIASTNEFKDFDSPKRYASYCGVAPFSRQSGSSLNKRPRVSYYGNKELKTALHLASIGYIRMPDSHLGQYYQKKVSEGKNKMSVLNAIRNKLVTYIFACVKNDSLYIEL